jgi:hypothetical protein
VVSGREAPHCGMIHEKMIVRLNFIEGCIASFHTLHFFCKNAASYLRGYLVFRAIILKKLSMFFKKWSYKKNERKAELHI